MKTAFRNAILNKKGKLYFSLMIGGILLMFIIAMFHLDANKVKTTVMLLDAFLVYFSGNRFSEILTLEVAKVDESKSKIGVKKGAR